MFIKHFGADIAVVGLVLLMGFFIKESGPVANKYGGVTIIPMQGKTMGADVYGLNIASVFDNHTALYELFHALETHLVLVFHNVSDSLTPEAQVLFTKMFGPVDPLMSGPPEYIYNKQFRSPEAVKRALANGADLNSLQESMIRAAASSVLPREVTRVVKEASDLLAFGEGWHTDLSFNKGTPSFACLVARELPPVGQGNTGFADMRAAWKRVPVHWKEELEGKLANHSDGAGRSSLHPVVRRDNKFGGEKSLFVNKAFTTSILGDEKNLLESVLEFIENMPVANPDAILSVSWAPGQMVMWDNRYTQHSANADYKVRREMHRTMVSGTVPF